MVAIVILESLGIIVISTLTDMIFFQPSNSVLVVIWVPQICPLSQFSFDFKECLWSMYTVSFINSDGPAICLQPKGYYAHNLAQAQVKAVTKW